MHWEAPSQAGSRGSCGISESWAHQGRKQRKSCTFSTHKKLTDYGPSQMTGLGDQEKAAKNSQHRGWAEGARRGTEHKPLQCTHKIGRAHV